MVSFTKSLSIRWSDLDPNFHIRHSVYYDLAAQQRIGILTDLGLTPAIMQEQQFGPVLFREECVFRKEIRFADDVLITASVAKLSADSSRWTIQHQFLSAEQKLFAVLTVDGAWMNTRLRKLASPTPSIVSVALDAFPKTETFVQE